MTDRLTGGLRVFCPLNDSKFGVILMHPYGEALERNKIQIQTLLTILSIAAAASCNKNVHYYFLSNGTVKPVFSSH